MALNNTDFADFFNGYTQAALATCTDETTPSGGYPLDKNYSENDIDAETIEKMRGDCQEFTRQFEGAIVEAVTVGYPRYVMVSAGIDFWLTRNRHGAGYWSSDLGKVGEDLTRAAHTFGEYTLYLGDDNKIYGG